jgi:hypothetical protein
MHNYFDVTEGKSGYSEKSIQYQWLGRGYWMLFIFL